MAILDDYLTRDELASELNVTKRTLIRWQNQADGLPFIILGRRVLYRRASVLSWLQGRETRPNPRRGKR